MRERDLCGMTEDSVRAVELSVDGISAKQLRRSGSIAARAARHALFRAREAL
jgi:hypothetical protein